MVLVTHKFRFIGVKIYKSFEYFNIRRFPPTLVIVYLHILILCNNDFGIIVEIVINENGNYFFRRTKTATIVAAAYEDSCIVLKVVIPLLRVLLLVRVHQ